MARLRQPLHSQENAARPVALTANLDSTDIATWIMASR